MSTPSKQDSRESTQKNNPNLVPDSLQGTDDTQSEFSVSALRDERREDDKNADDQASNAESSNDSNTAETESEFSINERLRGKS